MSCRQSFGRGRLLTLTVPQLRALLEIADQDGEVGVTAFLFDCLAGVSTDVHIADGRIVTTRGEVVAGVARAHVG